MRAEITYNDSKSYTVMGKRFECGVTRVINDPELIKHCSVTQGFAVRIFNEKKVIPVEQKAEEHDDTFGHSKATKKIRTVRDE